jgi:hypothetical protein
MGKKHRFRPEDYVEQSSAFLDLPREIRDHIYHYCLTKPGGIDLWPDKYLTDTEIKETPALAKRSGGVFRHQHDLEYVRRQLAVGILATCMQIYDEAWPHLYKANHFRFSMDVECTGLRRFLTTIGARNRTHLRSLELCAGTISNIRRIEPGANPDPITSGVKNHPKLHMSKLHIRRPIGDFTYGDQNFQYVVELLCRETPPLLHNLRFIIPPGWKLDGAWLPWATEVSDYNGNLSAAITKLLPWLNLIIVVQEGAALVDGVEREWLRSHGVTILYERGGFDTDLNTPNKEALELPGLGKEYDFFTGISTLFSEDTDTLPALGGKATRASGIDRTLRVLKGFGGCRFEHIQAYYCRACQKRYESQKQNKLEFPAWQIPARECTVWGWCYFGPIDAIMVKNPRRAAKQGLINDENHVQRWFDN